MISMKSSFLSLLHVIDIKVCFGNDFLVLTKPSFKFNTKIKGNPTLKLEQNEFEVV